MAIKNGILNDVTFREARHIGERIVPDLVVVHDTASRIEKGKAADYLRDNAAKVSVHFVIEMDGTIEQQVPVDRRANHAGKSHYHGRSGCNYFSIGIELVNPGKLQAYGNSDQGVAWWGERFPAASGLIDAETQEHGAGRWMQYPSAQIAALIELLQILFAQVPFLKDIRTHWYISPGRKIDTNPLFPLSHIRSLILGRDDPDDMADALSDKVSPGETVVINTHGDTLNMRRWPSFNPNVVGKIPDETILPVLRRGRFEHRDWLLVVYGGQEGWIVAAYADPVEENAAGFAMGVPEVQL